MCSSDLKPKLSLGLHLMNYCDEVGEYESVEEDEAQEHGVLVGDGGAEAGAVADEQLNVLCSDLLDGFLVRGDMPILVSRARGGRNDSRGPILPGIVDVLLVWRSPGP